MSATIPTFPVQVSEHGHDYGAAPFRHLTFKCPCGRTHTHGGGLLSEPVEDFQGHRNPHCAKFFPDGYNLALPEGGWTETDSYIVWLEDVTKQPFVRVKTAISSSRTRVKQRKDKEHERIVGYVVNPTAKAIMPRSFEVTVFTLHGYDPSGYMPVEGRKPSDLEAEHGGRVQYAYVP